MSENVISFPHHRSKARVDTAYENGRLRLIRCATLATIDAKLWAESNPGLSAVRLRDASIMWSMVEALRLAHAS